MPKNPETLFSPRQNDIILKDRPGGYYSTNIVLYRQHNNQWRFFVVYNGRILHTGRGESQAQAHTYALIFLKSKGYGNGHL